MQLSTIMCIIDPRVVTHAEAADVDFDAYLLLVLSDLLHQVEVGSGVLQQCKKKLSKSHVWCIK